MSEAPDTLCRSFCGHAFVKYGATVSHNPCSNGSTLPFFQNEYRDDFCLLFVIHHYVWDSVVLVLHRMLDRVVTAAGHTVVAPGLVG